VFVRNRINAAGFYYFYAPKIVTRTRQSGTLTSALPLFFSNMLTQELILDLIIPHTHQQQAAVTYTSCWVTWL